MQPGNTTGTTGTVGLEHFYPGMDDKHTINSKGEFVNRTVRKLENTVNKLSSDRNDQLQKVQDATQTSVYKRRIKILKEHGDFHNTAERLNANTHNGRNGQLAIIDDKKLEDDIERIRGIADDKLADKDQSHKPIGNDKDHKIVISQKALKTRAQKDLTIFFAQSINKAITPHTLLTLRHFISQEETAEGITPKQASALKKVLIKKADVMTRALPQFTLPASKGDETESHEKESHETETKKLQYVHDLDSMLKIVAPGVLKVHKNTIKNEAVKAFINATNHLKPHDSSFGETRKILAGIELDKNELLQPVLKGTCKDTQQLEKALAGIDTEIKPTVNLMNIQLAEIKNRTLALHTAAKNLSEYQKNLGQLTIQLKAKIRDLGSKKSEYDQLMNNAGSKLKRRFNASYQWARRTNRIEQKTLAAQNVQLQQQFKDLEREILDQKRQYAHQRSELVNIRKKYSDSQYESLGDVIDPRSTVGNTSFDQVLSDLEARNKIEESDVVTAHRYFSTLAQLDVPEEAINRMAVKYEQLVEEESFDGYQALWVISSMYSNAQGSNFEDDCDRESAYLSKHTELIPTRSPKPHGRSVSQPEPLQLESRLANANPSDKAPYSNSAVAGYVKEVAEKNPQLKAKIDEICQFYLDGLESDQKASDNNSTDFNTLFVEHYTALGIGIRALVADQSSAGDACSKMTDYLESRDNELNKPSNL